MGAIHRLQPHLMMMKISTLGSPKELSPVENLRFVLHDFALVDATKQEVVMPSIDAHGYDWTLVLYPHGRFYPGYLSAGISFDAVKLESFTNATIKYTQTSSIDFSARTNSSTETVVVAACCWR